LPFQHVGLPYHLVESGASCQCNGGPCASQITTLAECEAAARYVNTLGAALESTTAHLDEGAATAYDPPYCYFEGNELKLNQAGTNTGHCTRADRCLCRGEGAPHGPPPPAPPSAPPAAWWAIASGRGVCEYAATALSPTACVTDGAGDYSNGEDCEFALGEDAYVVIEQYDVEANHDHLTHYPSDAPPVQYTPYNLPVAPTGVLLPRGSRFKWHTDSSTNGAGFRICALPTAPSLPPPPQPIAPPPLPTAPPASPPAFDFGDGDDQAAQATDFLTSLPLPGGTVAAIVIGVLLGLVLLANLACACVLLRRKADREQSAEEVGKLLRSISGADARLPPPAPITSTSVSLVSSSSSAV
jgi:hypothetical protein